MDTARPSILRFSGLTKSFGGAKALNDVSFEIGAGEVHGLLGENGSGKSTLIKVLAGFHDVDAGRLEIGGEDVPLPLPAGRPAELGLDFVHQDLGLIDDVSVLENLRLREITNARLRISWARERRIAGEIFERYGIDVDLREKVGNVRPVVRAQIAIARAVESMRVASQSRGTSGGLLVLDEPTVFLPGAEVEQLFDLIREIVRGGASVLFVSHDLDEVLQITDRITVLRDGRAIATVETPATSRDQLIELIVGRPLEAATAESVGETIGSNQEPALTLDGLHGRTVRDVSLRVAPGEVLGITGLMGSGFEEPIYHLFGAERAGAGTARVGEGSTLDLTKLDPRTAMGAGMAMIPADRQREGSIGTLSVSDNITGHVLSRHTVGGLLRPKRLRQHAAELLDEFDVRPRDPSMAYSSLSGGNQQKALLAKWLQIDPKLLLLHEPTQGVDIGARQQILTAIRERAASTHMGVLCASADHEQLALFCDRVVVFGRGRIVSELRGASVTKDTILQHCYASATAPFPQPSER
jgi:ribose transport system ATP-binding protein